MTLSDIMHAHKAQDLTPYERLLTLVFLKVKEKLEQADCAVPADASIETAQKIMLEALDGCLIATTQDYQVYRLVIPNTNDPKAPNPQIMIHAEEDNDTVDISIWPGEELEPDEPVARMEVEWMDLT